jgi:hypothetical protein
MGRKNEVQDIFRIHGEEYRQRHKIPLNQLKAMIAIETCRTAELGGHKRDCPECGYTEISFNSCRNRHCPKCQSINKEKWLEARKGDLLPVGYFHVVFTIPKEIEPIAIRNQKLVYDILLKSASETLLELAKDKKHLGAEIGFFSILNTWGQNLINHTHVHCIVPSGGISLDGTTWINAKKTSEGNDFFIHVNVLSTLFKKKFMDYLVKAYNNHQLKLVGEIKYLMEKNIFKCLRSDLYEKRWNVYCKAPFKNAENVLEYLGRYTHRVGISNDRIVHFENGFVTFKWRDYKDNNKEKFMTVSAEEFIRRFLLHVLPHKYVKIRHYGILSNKNKKTKLALCRSLMGVKISNNSVAKLTTAELILKITGLDIDLCPCCKKGKLIFKEKILPKTYSPPGETKTIA